MYELKKIGKVFTSKFVGTEPSSYEKVYSFCLMVEASDHGYVLHTRRIHVTRYRKRTLRKLLWFISTVLLL
jgi:hypothetical protein